jgi:hypothetical protein
MDVVFDNKAANSLNSQFIGIHKSVQFGDHGFYLGYSGLL